APTSGSLGDIPRVGWDWFGQVYRSYWFDYLPYEVRQKDLWFYLPLAIGLICIGSLLVFIVRAARSQVTGLRVQARQALVLFVVSVGLVLPFMAVDVRRALGGLAFEVQAGRFMTPAYAAVVVLALLGIRALASGRAKWHGAAVMAL